MSSNASGSSPGKPSGQGFSLSDSNFDVWNNQVIKDYLVKKAQEGVLNGEYNATEDEIEQEAKQVVEDWEKVEGRSATTEERERMMNKIRQIRSISWLEGAKKELVGQTTAPIAYFNRLLAEHEGTIGYIARKMTDVSKDRQAMVEEIHNLRDENARLATTGSSQCEEENAKLTDEKAKLAEENAKLTDDKAKLSDENAELTRDKATLSDHNAQLSDHLTKQLDDIKQLADGNDKLASNNTKLLEEITHLRDEAAKRNKQPSEDDKCKDKTERLESELRAVYRQRQERDEKIESIEEQLQESRGRERAVRESIRSQDSDMRDLKSTIDRLTRDNDLLRHRSGKSEEKQTNADPNGNFDVAIILAELREARELDRDVSADASALIDRWMGQVAEVNHLREYHVAVEDIKAQMQTLRERVLAMYGRLGLDATDKTAEDAMQHIEEELAKQPNEKMGVHLWALKLAMDVQLEKTRVLTEQKRYETLQIKHEMEKLDEEEREEEVMMRYNMYNDQEIERRVDSLTQTYRIHRRQILDHIFGAADELQVVGIMCTHEQTRVRINEIRDKYLNPLTLPVPKLQPSRMD